MNARAGFKTYQQPGWAVSRPDNGFTLLEMLAALVLSGLLVMSIGSVLRSAMTQNSAARIESKTQPALRRLTAQLQRDIKNARGFRQIPRGFLLSGFSGTDLQSRLPTLDPAIVTYRVLRIADRSWLVRDEQRTNIPGRNGISSDAVFSGVAAIDTATSASDAIAQPTPDGLPVMPEQIRVTLSAASGETILSQTFQSRLPFLE